MSAHLAEVAPPIPGAILDKASLLASRVGEVVDFPIPDVGTVRIRGLSRQEALDLRKIPAGAENERAMIAMSLVEPALTPDEVGAWMTTAPAGEFEPLTSAIVALSGMGAGSAKAAYQRFRGGPRA